MFESQFEGNLSLAALRRALSPVKSKRFHSSKYGRTLRRIKQQWIELGINQQQQCSVQYFHRKDSKEARGEYLLCGSTINIQEIPWDDLPLKQYSFGVSLSGLIINTITAIPSRKKGNTFAIQVYFVSSHEMVEFRHGVEALIEASKVDGICCFPEVAPTLEYRTSLNSSNESASRFRSTSDFSSFSNDSEIQSNQEVISAKELQQTKSILSTKFDDCEISSSLSRDVNITEQQKHPTQIHASTKSFNYLERNHYNVQEPKAVVDQSSLRNKTLLDYDPVIKSVSASMPEYSSTVKGNSHRDNETVSQKHENPKHHDHQMESDRNNKTVDFDYERWRARVWQMEEEMENRLSEDMSSTQSLGLEQDGNVVSNNTENTDGENKIRSNNTNNVTTFGSTITANTGTWHNKDKQPASYNNNMPEMNSANNRNATKTLTYQTLNDESSARQHACHMQGIGTQSMHARKPDTQYTIEIPRKLESDAVLHQFKDARVNDEEVSIEMQTTAASTKPNISVINSKTPYASPIDTNEFSASVLNLSLVQQLHDNSTLDVPSILESGKSSMSCEDQLETQLPQDHWITTVSTEPVKSDSQVPDTEAKTATGASNEIPDSVAESTISTNLETVNRRTELEQLRVAYASRILLLPVDAHHETRYWLEQELIAIDKELKLLVIQESSDAAIIQSVMLHQLQLDYTSSQHVSHVNDASAHQSHFKDASPNHLHQSHLKNISPDKHQALPQNDVPFKQHESTVRKNRPESCLPDTLQSVETALSYWNASKQHTFHNVVSQLSSTDSCIQKVCNESNDKLVEAEKSVKRLIELERERTERNDSPTEQQLENSIQVVLQSVLHVVHENIQLKEHLNVLSEELYYRTKQKMETFNSSFEQMNTNQGNVLNSEPNVDPLGCVSGRQKK